MGRVGRGHHSLDAEEVSSDVDSISLPRRGEDHLSQRAAVDTVVSVEGNVAKKVGGVDSAGVTLESASQDYGSLGSPGVGHRDQVVAGVVTVLEGLANVVHVALDSVQDVVEVGGEKHLFSYAGYL